jgi:hypothetical protein
MATTTIEGFRDTTIRSMSKKSPPNARTLNMVPSKPFVYDGDNFFGASIELFIRKYDRERWAHLTEEKKHVLGESAS